MTPEEWEQRLSQITTQWTLLRQAHGAPGDEAAVALDELMQRYCGAAYRYLVGALRDDETARDLFQEFALRFVRGDFRAVRRERGRFRDYVKTVLIHLVNDHFRDRRRHPAPLPAQLAAPTAPSQDEQFVHSWREELIGHAWAALERFNPTYHAVLLYRAGHPTAESAEMATELSARLGKPLTPGNVRTTLHRAREKFADLLVAEVENSLEAPGDERLLHEELKQLRLDKLCQPALRRRG